MSGIGVLLKYYRTQKKKTQTDLCMGICTPSYLSRIENNLIEADDEIYSLLFERLDLSYEKIIQDNCNLDQRLEEWYKDMFFQKESKENIEELKGLCMISSPDILIKFEITYCRYLILTQDIELSLNKINSLRKLSIPAENNRNYFLYVNVLLLYHFRVKEYSEALRIGIKASNTDGFESLGKDYEVGAFYYNLALNYKNLYIYDKSRYYAEKALRLFLDNYYLELAIDCQILLGISFNNTGNWSDSLRSYLKAKRLLNYLPEKYHDTYLGMIENNIGYCYQRIGEYEKAINYYSKSLIYKKDNEQLLTLINLVHCHHLLGNSSKSKKLLIKSLGLRTASRPVNLSLQLDFMSLIILEDILSLEEIIELEQIFEELVKRNFQDAIIHYGETLAKLFEKYHHYKKAAKVYKSILYTNKGNLSGNNPRIQRKTKYF
ncbi:helix-turn-helix transcriptional regulator [Ornithinibacillus bavariensis]|uniref:HTH cro/C1-type domain-containing protein n=1 Tax=Ornithinibacillus bavariensis TaxID=545502 RepID=A0A920C6N3_9BACI|nr:helix-turn-helix transcriptional regulator [Ornithinibacillus bavariensis]GIO27985.1 hypothetical protein J43TS3_25960 [Ornithinibacillus bavariensis]